MFQIRKYKYAEKITNPTINICILITYFNLLALLLCLIAIANNNIVPGQCAEYAAPSVSPVILIPIEYNIQIKANIIG
tara:strand:- start:150 stop:383 length:234 start_codon:yes stop_codon:yes gene_type:complete